MQQGWPWGRSEAGRQECWIEGALQPNCCAVDVAVRGLYRQLLIWKKPCRRELRKRCRSSSRQ